MVVRELARRLRAERRGGRGAAFSRRGPPVPGFMGNLTRCRGVPRGRTLSTPSTPSPPLARPRGARRTAQVITARSRLASRQSVRRAAPAARPRASGAVGSWARWVRPPPRRGACSRSRACWLQGSANQGRVPALRNRRDTRDWPTFARRGRHRSAASASRRPGTSARDGGPTCRGGPRWLSSRSRGRRACRGDDVRAVTGAKSVATSDVQESVPAPGRPRSAGPDPEAEVRRFQVSLADWASARRPKGSPGSPVDPLRPLPQERRRRPPGRPLNHRLFHHG
jgi:hypothetical protein